MLHRLSIRNYAIIDKLDIEFHERMNIITGETGAGKSILIGALNLILGERAETKVLYNTSEKCVVEAEFIIENQNLKSFFQEHELDFETHTTIRREINQSGKSRAFVNDTPVNLQILKLLGEQVVNLHSQHETLDLTESGFQLHVIDTIAQNTDLLLDYQQKFASYQAKVKKLSDLIDSQKQASAEKDFVEFQFQELDDARLQEGEQEVLEAEQVSLSNVEEIVNALQNAIQLIDGNEEAILDRLAESINQLKSVRSYKTEIGALEERLHSAHAELKDINYELGRITERSTPDPERLEEVNNRLNLLYRLMKKHQVTFLVDLIGIKASLEDKLRLNDQSDKEIGDLQALIGKQLNEITGLAEKLHQSREKKTGSFELQVTKLLHKVGMPGAIFKVFIRKLANSQLSRDGCSEIKFLFSANKGFEPQEIKSVASGGELSRLMLCIKSLIADAGSMPTMIFDEIDSGISGEVALKVGEIMKQLSRQHQLISITHLPQIARVADEHLYIYKETEGDRTVTRVKKLMGEERVQEIAKMLSGEKISDAALANARELMSLSQN